jgi:hypothetical protein
VPGKGFGTRVEHSEGVNILQLVHDGLKGEGKFVVMAELQILRVEALNNTIEVSNNQRGDLQAQPRPQTAEHGLPTRLLTRTGREVYMGKRKGFPLNELNIPWLHIRDVNLWLTRQDRHNPAGRVTNGHEYRIPSSTSKARKLGSKPNLLEKNKVGPVLPQQSRETSQIRQLKAI